MFLTIRTWNVHGGFSGKNLDHSIITKTCQKWPFFDFDQILMKNRGQQFSGKNFGWNYNVLGVSPRKPHVRRGSRSFFKKFSVRRVYAFRPFWMIHMGFGQFLAFRTSDRLDIAYFDRTKWCAWVGHDITHAGSFKIHKNAFLNDPNSQKWGFWPFSWVRCIGSTSNCILWLY